LAQIAILPTSKPLRIEVIKRGKRKQALNGKVIGELAAHFDLIICGSTASDQFYEFLFNSLPLNQRARFRLYGRSFFASQPIEENPQDIRDPRSLGWMEILTENHINFEMVRKAMGSDLLPRMESFNWENMEDFILDGRVKVLRTEQEIFS
jgi:hypothetical protein